MRTPSVISMVPTNVLVLRVSVASFPGHSHIFNVTAETREWPGDEARYWLIFSVCWTVIDSKNSHSSQAMKFRQTARLFFIFETTDVSELRITFEMDLTWRGQPCFQGRCARRRSTTENISPSRCSR